MGDLSGFLPQWQSQPWQQGGLPMPAPQQPALSAQDAGRYQGLLAASLAQLNPQFGPGPQYAPHLGPAAPDPGPQYAPRLGPDQVSGPQYNPGAGLDLTRAVGIPFMPHGQQVGSVGAVNPAARPGPLLHPELVALLSQILRRFNSRPQIKHRRPAD